MSAQDDSRTFGKQLTLLAYGVWLGSKWGFLASAGYALLWSCFWLAPEFGLWPLVKWSIGISTLIGGVTGALTAGIFLHVRLSGHYERANRIGRWVAATIIIVLHIATFALYSDSWFLYTVFLAVPSLIFYGLGGIVAERLRERYLGYR